MITAWFLYLYIHVGHAQYIVVSNIATEAECERIATEVFQQDKSTRFPVFSSQKQPIKVCFSYQAAK